MKYQNKGKIDSPYEGRVNFLTQGQELVPGNS